MRMTMAEPTWWERLLGWFTPAQKDEADRLRTLTRAVERHPHSSAAYLRRGEVYLSSGDLKAAAQDFRQALALADMQFRTETWGFVAQAVRDRALQGLAQVQDLSRASVESD